jgi:MtrB/PioB family decaheme-associated outer membrane protein
MKTATQLFLLSILSALSASATGQAVDTSKWECKLCKFEKGVSGTVELGVGHVSDSSFKFGEYNGLQKQGAYFIGNGSARFRGADAAYWDVDAANLGLDTRSLDAEGGRQGSYKLLLNYQELPHFVSDSAQTPFIGSGGAALTLPAGYPAGTTGLMPLAGTLQSVDLETKRKKLGIGASWTPPGAWKYAVSYRHQTRDGTKGTAGSFFVNAAQLVAPVDYETDQIDASASYTGAKLQAKIAYYGSTFRNSDASLTWQNPYTMLAFPGAVAGQLALPPDNQFHQLSASLGYQFTDRTRASADIAYGRMTQNDTFLAQTLNTTLAVPAMTRSSLDGRANVLNAKLELNSAVTDQLRLKAAYTRNDRDNRTQQAATAWVTTDMFLAAPRTNLPYSFTQDKLKLRADYKATPRTKASVGYDYDSIQRTFQEVDRTRENTFWGKIASRAMDNVDLTLKLGRGKRSKSDYVAVAAITPPENPLLRKFNMADRTRDSAEVRVDIAATDSINIGLRADASKDDYSESSIGLTSGKELNVDADVSMMLTAQTSVHLFANYQKIKSNQAGSQTFSTPDWSGENQDTFKLFGVGVKHAAIKDKLDLGADFTVTRSRGTIRVNTAATNSVFPDLSTSRDSLKLYAIYRLEDNVSLRGGYWYERYDSENWMIDGVAPNTIPNVLTFGEQSPRYRVHVFAASVRYDF